MIEFKVGFSKRFIKRMKKHRQDTKVLNALRGAIAYFEV